MSTVAEMPSLIDKYKAAPAKERGRGKPAAD